jgi:hypothetical protein
MHQRITRSLLLCLVTALTIAGLPASPAFSDVTGGGGDDSTLSPTGPGGGGGGSGTPAADQAAVDAQVLRSFTANPLSVAQGQNSRFDWVVEGPSDVTLRLDGFTVPRAGLQFVKVQDPDQPVSLVATKGAASRTLGTLVVGVNPCVGPGSHPATCHRGPRLRFDYQRQQEDFAFKGSKLVNPASNGWLTFKACASQAGRHGRIERYRWTLRQLGQVPFRTSSDRCAITVRLGEGQWSGTFQIRGADGAVVSTPVSVNVHDLFVVSLGDSMASGEGNPDVPGNYLPLPQETAHWQYEPCHRSAISGHVKAAKELSQDTHTGLVFLSLACSGAGIENVWFKKQGSQKPQLDALKEAVCRFRCDQPIDVLFLTVGVNNVNFANIVKKCSVLRFHHDCGDEIRKGQKAAPRINEQLGRIQMGLRGRGLVVKRVVITEYPANLFDGGCTLRKVRITDLGHRLNAEIRAGAKENGWVYAGGIEAAFKGHSFCKSGSASWFRSLTTSLDQQGDKEGTAHPTAPGHRAIARRLLVAYRASLPPDQPEVHR